ncbi:pyridoxal phosphate-dependent aminotransferase [Alteribacter natronophilus]|uniref:pyridoxal phosphate-dependent aminotransferase n=1 Tax=Alteribacter natronophilus TaxID=2583810 RepID=UPI00110DCEB8|nr:pyridoxal phosphate-dependent aminotransferase [Alteribacter natronophilus]TMW73560.1 pyridoxal phosphate-dependent aminotransferase [Alteribacter natronophilus]
MKLSPRVTGITPSSTLAITAKAKELKAAGHDVIGLGAGEPDFNTPAHIITAAAESMDAGHTKYTPAGGMPELKKAVSAKFLSDQGLEYSAEEIIVTNGAKHALALLFQTILNEGDEVIIPSPYWVSYPEQVKIAGGQPVVVKAGEENEFKLSPEELEAAVTEKTRAVILNSPGNPTGVMYSAEELKEIGEICLKHGLLIVSDEIYEKLIYGEARHTSIASLSDALKEQTVIINGVSKSHSMTGWRIGYAAGNKLIIKAMTTLASHTTSNPAVMAQYGAAAAYSGSDEAVEEMRKAFEERLEKGYRAVSDIPGFSCVKPQGAFYLFPNVSEAVKNSPYETTDEWVAALLEQEKVAVVPGSGFGSPDNIRLSYATAYEQFSEAAARIRRFVDKNAAK